ncbi:MAG: hypothetical protein ACFFDH_04295 [Promethearchaeota archaeon]
MADNKDFTPQEYEDLIKELIKENQELKRRIAELESQHQKYQVQREIIETPKPVIETYNSIVDTSPPKITHAKIEPEKLVEETPIEEEIQPIKQTHKKIVSESIFSEKIPTLEMHKGEIMVGDSRRECPKCGNKNKLLIRETVDKAHLICDYPRMYGKKYHCGDCGIEWRVPLEM